MISILRLAKEADPDRSIQQKLFSTQVSKLHPTQLVDTGSLLQQQLGSVVLELRNSKYTNTILPNAVSSFLQEKHTRSLHFATLEVQSQALGVTRDHLVDCTRRHFAVSIQLDRFLRNALHEGMV